MGHRTSSRVVDAVILASGANHGVVSFASECGTNLTMRGTVTCQMGQRNQYTETEFHRPLNGPSITDRQRQFGGWWETPCADGDYAFGKRGACGGHVVAYTTITMKDLPQRHAAGRVRLRARVAPVSDRLREQPRSTSSPTSTPAATSTTATSATTTAACAAMRAWRRSSPRWRTDMRIAMLCSSCPVARPRRPPTIEMPPEADASRSRRRRSRRRWCNRTTTSPPSTSHSAGARRESGSSRTVRSPAASTCRSLHQAPNDTTSAQNPTVAVSRLGLRGGVGEHVTFASEFEASLGGPHRLRRERVGRPGRARDPRSVRALHARRRGRSRSGRIDDPASFDFVSRAHRAICSTPTSTRAIRCSTRAPIAATACSAATTSPTTSRAA